MERARAISLSVSTLLTAAIYAAYLDFLKDSELSSLVGWVVAFAVPITVSLTVYCVSFIIFRTRKLRAWASGSNSIEGYWILITPRVGDEVDLMPAFSIIKYDGDVRLTVMTFRPSESVDQHLSTRSQKALFRDTDCYYFNHFISMDGQVEGVAYGHFYPSVLSEKSIDRYAGCIVFPGHVGVREQQGYRIPEAEITEAKEKYPNSWVAHIIERRSEWGAS